MPKTDFTGTGVAIVTPFRTDGSIDFKSLGKLLEHIITNGVEYVVILGTTGESVTLSKDEKEAIINYGIDIINKRIPLVVGLGGNNTQDIITKIHTLNVEGIGAILSVSPYYNKPSQEGIYRHFKAISNASPVPVIIYNVPGRTGSNITSDTTLRLAADFKNIIAIKEASGNLCQVMHIINNKPKNFQVISGDDALTLPIIAIGGSGVISVVANAYPKEFSDLVRDALKNDFIKARENHYRLIELIDGLFLEGSPSGIKAVLEIIGISQNNLRLPLAPVSENLYKKLKELVKKI